MAATSDSLRQSLETLKHALGEAEAIDAHTLAELRDTLEGIERQLARLSADTGKRAKGGEAKGGEAKGGEAKGGEAKAAEASMADRLTGGAYRLEASHPDLALALHQIAESLSEIGI